MSKRKRTKKDSVSDLEKPRKRRKPNKARKFIESMDKKELKSTLINLTYSHPELQQEVLNMGPKTDVDKEIGKLSTVSRKADRARKGRFSTNDSWSLGKASGFLSPWGAEIMRTLKMMEKRKELKKMIEYMGKVYKSMRLFPSSFSVKKGRGEPYEEVSLKDSLEKSVKSGYLFILKIKNPGFTRADYNTIIEDVEDYGFEEEVKKICEERLKNQAV